MRKRTLNQIKKHSRELRNCHTKKELSRLLGYTKNQMTLLSFEPLYFHFTVQKKENRLRYIEAPDYELKRFQRILNHYLQTVYYENQTQAAQGYIIKPIGAKHKKNIYTNAHKHLGKDYMMNVDFKDFFHQISQKDVTNIFNGALFSLDKNTAHTLAKICCYKNRLPMGAPTSPVLSNIYTIQLDKELTDWATLHDSIYTRFVDDLCFSSDSIAFCVQHFDEVQKIASKYHLNFNKEKTKYFDKNEVKKVTGLVLKETVDIDPKYYLELDHDITRLQHATEVVYLTKNHNQKDFLKAYKQELHGKIAFIASIEGKDSKQYLDYLNRYYKALEPPSDELVRRWTKFSNYQ